MNAMYRDRRDAGRSLAEMLRPLATHGELTILGLPRGGVPVAYEVAMSLNAPLDVFVVRKLGVPGHEELAMGAIATGGIRVLNSEVIRQLGISSDAVERVTRDEERELTRRELAYRGGRGPAEVRGKTVIIVDDGLATGATMAAAVAALRKLGPDAIIVAVPYGSPDTCAAMRAKADACVCARSPRDFRGVGEGYADFGQTTDAEVRALLERAAERFDGAVPEEAAATSPAMP